VLCANLVPHGPGLGEGNGIDLALDDTERVTPETLEAALCGPLPAIALAACSMAPG